MATNDPITVELSDGRTVELHESWQRPQREFGVGAYHHGELVGLLVCEDDGARVGHASIFVRPEWRDVGVGRALVRHMADVAAAIGVAYLSVSYGVDNVAASKMLDATGLIVARRVRDRHEKAVVLVPEPASLAA